MHQTNFVDFGEFEEEIMESDSFEEEDLLDSDSMVDEVTFFLLYCFLNNQKHNFFLTKGFDTEEILSSSDELPNVFSNPTSKENQNKDKIPHQFGSPVSSTNDLNQENFLSDSSLQEASTRDDILVFNEKVLIWTKDQDKQILEVGINSLDDQRLTAFQKLVQEYPDWKRLPEEVFFFFFF